MGMTNKQRLDLLEAFLRTNRYADLGTLSRRFEISLSTVRRSLNELESRGLIRRHHGGASWVEAEEIPGGYDFITQDDRQSVEKHALATWVGERIEPGMTVMLDGGTTTYAVARQLVGKRIIVVTNSLPIAALLNEVSSSETIVTGGTVYNRLGVLCGPICENSLAEMHADLAVLSGAGITEEGVWNSNSMVVASQKRMLRAADRTLFALDHTKFGKRALTLTCPFSPKMTVLTTAQPELRIARAMKAAGTECEVVTVPQATLSEKDS